MQDKMECPLFRIGELAEKSGKTNRAIRFYEQKGLIAPKSRSSAGYRLYDQQSLFRIEWIERLQTMGFSLGEIQVFLSEVSDLDKTPSNMKKIHEFYSMRLAETRLKRKRLLLLEMELEKSLDFLGVCNSCIHLHEVNACGICDVHEKQNSWPKLVSALVKDV